MKTAYIFVIESRKNPNGHLFCPIFPVGRWTHPQMQLVNLMCNAVVDNFYFL